MASAQQDVLFSALPSSVQDVAVDLSAEGASEYAFPVEISSQVFDVYRSPVFDSRRRSLEKGE